MFKQHRAIWILIALALLSLGVGAAQIAARSQGIAGVGSRDDRHLVTQSQMGTEAVPIVVKSIPQPKSDAELAQEKSDREQRERNDGLLVKFNGILAIFTVVLAVSTILLWRETRRLRMLADQQASDTKQSLALTKRSADAALALELPIFIIESVTIEPGNATYTISLGNHGRTPAIVTQSSLMTVLGPVLPPSPRYPGHSVEEIEISRIVEKGHEFKISRDSTLSEADWSRVLKGEVILWAYGYLDYIDFQRIKRRTAFCRAFMPRPDKSYQNSSKKGDWVRQGPEAYTYDSPQCSSYEGNGVLPSRGGCPSRWPLGCCLSKLTSLKTSLPWRCCVSISL